MPVLRPTEVFGEVVWLGLVVERAVTLRAEPVKQISMTFQGLEGEAHSGLTRPSCERVTSQYAKGTEIRNVRQVSILSEEEMAATAEAMGLPRLDPSWVGANIVLRGIPDFTQIPPSSRLIAENGASLTVDMENAPCQFPAREIEAEHPGRGKGYKSAAKGRRGVTAWVEREGEIALGSKLRLHIPPQRIYAHA